MPRFPTYPGELPECLNPLNLRHYFLLAYWVYFRPTALKCYLYQANPELYRAGPGLDIFRTWRVPAYRNLYLMIPGVILSLSVLIGLPLLLASVWGQNTLTISWLDWVRGLSVSVLIGITFAAVGGTALGLAGGVALSALGGVTGGITLGVVGGTGSLLNIEMIGVASYLATLTFAVALGTALTVTFGVAGTVTSGATVGTALSFGGGYLSIMLFGLTTEMGVLRAAFYPFQLVIALLDASNASRGERHPLKWDELATLPMMGTSRALTRQLQSDATRGLRFLAQVAANPFQRWAAQRASQTYLHNHSSVRFLYTLIVCPDLQAYIFAPVRREDWEHLPSVRRLLLGELDGRWVDYGSDWPSRLTERLVWALTWPLRDRRQTPLTRFAGMLYELLDEEAVAAADGFDLAAYADVYTGLTDYPGGEEIARTFQAMAAFLSCADLSELRAAARNQVFTKNLVSDEGIRPTVLAALDGLRQVGEEIATYQDATSRVNQLAALARATDALDDLDEMVQAAVMAPERTILRRIIRQWRRLVSEVGGAVGRIEQAGPVANPYVAGNPVIGEIFVGREDILRRLEELWSGAGQKPSVVLYGHRRMGKSSILHNLGAGARFGTRTLVVDFNMQRVGLVSSTGELLYNLALALYDAQILQETDTAGRLAEPGEDRFLDHNPTTAFDRFLKRLDQARGERRFIVTVDEFELIEWLIADGKLEPRLLDFWRGLIQTYPWFVMAFAGLHTLQEMTHDYWHPLYGSVLGIPVSFLAPEAARRLITQPSLDFSLDYDQDAVERIVALTNGQSYLVQLICHGLVTRYNRRAFEEGMDVGLTFPGAFPISFGLEKRLTLVDVEAVVAASEFYRDGDAYFTGVWRQAETSEPSGQTAILRVLARTRTGLPVEIIARRTELSLVEVEGALKTLARHDVVEEEEDGRWRFTVELMRRWVLQREEE